jgi:hypothetical protein
MRSVKAWSGFILIALVGIMFWRSTLSERPDVLCTKSGGLWFSGTKVCIAPNCYESKTCGVRSSPGLDCRKLRLGDSIDRAYFVLGEPSQKRGDELTWPLGKSENTVIIVGFSGDKISRLNCDKAP